MKKTLFVGTMIVAVAAALAMVHGHTAKAADITELRITTQAQTVLTDKDVDKATRDEDLQFTPEDADVDLTGAQEVAGGWYFDTGADLEPASGATHPTYAPGSYRYRLSMVGVKLKNGKTFPAAGLKIIVNGVEFIAEGIGTAYYDVDTGAGVLSFVAYSPLYTIKKPAPAPAAPAVPNPAAPAAPDNPTPVAPVVPAKPAVTPQPAKSAEPAKAPVNTLADTGTSLHAVVIGALAVIAGGTVIYQRYGA